MNGHIPKLPELDKDEVRAVRSFLPGKLLSRAAAFLSLGLLVLGLFTAADIGLRRLLGAELTLHLPLYYTLLIGLPFIAVATQLVLEFRVERNRRSLQALAVRTGVDQSGYFRIGPYLNTAEDRAKFSRADRAQHKVLNWIERSALIPLYMTGDSGSGKSSLLNAFVLPALKERGWVVVEARVWQDAEEALRGALATLPGAPRAGEKPELAELIAAAAQRAEAHLLLVIDQFEEFVILAKPEQGRRFQALIAELRSRQIKGLSLLLVLRSEYQTFLEDLGLPPLRQGENFFQVGRFTLSAGSDFMKQSQLSLQPDGLDRLLTSAAELDETPGLVRAITLNMIGYVLAAGRERAPSLDAGPLVRHYIEQTVNQPAIRGFAPPILEQLITEQGTKRPRSESELAKQTGCRPAEVRAVLTGLGDAALARPLDPAQGVWELSHDFVARAVARYLGRQRSGLLRRSGVYAAPVLLAVTLLAVAGVFAWNQLRPEQLRLELADLGVAVTSQAEGESAEVTSRFAETNLARAGPLLGRLTRVVKLNLSKTQVANLEPLKGLTALQTLDLSETRVANLKPIRGLTALKTLNVSKTQVANLEPLKGLSKLQTLDLSKTRVENLEPLKGLAKLQMLDLSGTKIADLEPLKGLTELQMLDLFGTPVADLRPLKGLIKLRTLDLSSTEVTDLEPLKGLTALQYVILWSVEVADLEPLKGLTALQTLNLAYDSKITDLEPLKGLTNLQTLNLTGTQVDSLEPLKGLSKLQTLDLTDLTAAHIADLEPLKGLAALQTLYLANTRVTNLEPLKGLAKLQMLDLSSTKIADLEPLKGLAALQSLILWGTEVADLEPLKGLSKLQTLDLFGTPVADLRPLKNLKALNALNLSKTQVFNLEPLKGLTELQKLGLGRTNITDLEPLKGLTKLQELYLSLSKVADLTPLTGLTELQELFVTGTQVADLAPVQDLPNLRVQGLPTLEREMVDRFKRYRKHTDQSHVYAAEK